MTNEDFQAIIDRYLEGSATPDEEKLLNAYYDDRIQNRPGIASWSEEEKELAKSRLKKSLNAHIRLEETSSKPASGAWYKLAASIVFILGIAAALWYFTYPQPAEVRYLSKSTIRGQKATIVLSDGTRVRLNSESNIRYPEEFTGDLREIKLEGEAFFEVAEDPTKPFVVQSGTVKTRVLGTSFNINAYPESEAIRVTVATGRVQVANGEDPTSFVQLTRGDQATYSKTSRTLEEKQVDLDRFIAWSDNRIVFEDVSLGEAVDILNRWFDTDIELEKAALAHCDIQGTFENETLTNILESIKFVKGINYQLLGNKKIVITGDSCQ